MDMNRSSTLMLVAGLCSFLALVTGVLGFALIMQSKIVAGLIFLLGLAQVLVFAGFYSYNKAKTLAKTESPQE